MKQIFYFVTFFAFYCSTYSVLAQTYYVSTTGNDTNNGTTEATAWRTIQKAANSATAGSTVYIKAGTYNEKVVMGVNGTSGNYITFTHFGTDVVTIDGTGVSGTILLKIHNKSYLRIVGLHFTNCIGNDSQGILVDGTSHHIELRNNHISNIHFSSNPNAVATETQNSQPLIVYGTSNTPITNLIIDGNEVFNSRTGYSEGLAVNGNVDGFEITNNLVHDLTNIGIDVIGHEGTCPTPSLDQARNGVVRYNRVWRCSSPYAEAAGIYTDGARDVVIENNDISHGQYGISIGCENQGKTSSNIIARNNLIYRNGSACVDFGGYNYPSTGKVINSQFYNNTCFLNDTTNSSTGELAITYTENCSLRNNLILATNQGTLGYKAFNSIGLTLDYNVYYSTLGSSNVGWDWNNNWIGGFANYQTQTGKDAHSMFVNPMLTNTTPQSPDLHLLCNSPCINAGDPNLIAAATELDMDNQTRTYNSLTDVGADEVQATTPIIMGSNNICSDNLTQTYSTTAVLGATYTWAVTNGNITAGQGSNTITVQWNNTSAGTVSLSVEP